VTTDGPAGGVRFFGKKTPRPATRRASGREKPRAKGERGVRFFGKKIGTSLL
jgi:hypothetical protein